MRPLVIADLLKRSGLDMGHRVLTKKGADRSAPFFVPALADAAAHYEQPDVEPQVLHFMQVPLRTRVKLPQAPQLSPSKPFSRASTARAVRLWPCEGLAMAASRVATWALTVLKVASTPARISDRSNWCSLSLSASKRPNCSSSCSSSSLGAAPPLTMAIWVRPRR